MSRAEDRVFGKRRQQHIIILASGEKVRHMTIRPWMAAIGFCLVGVMAIGYLAATSYLVLRDNLIGATMARQARMQHEYEDRIAALRAQVDRVTSRQLLDQQLVESKVEKLLEQQMALSSRHGKLDSLLDRAEESGIAAPTIPVPEGKPTKTDRANLTGGNGAFDALLGRKASVEPSDKRQSALSYAPLRETTADRADRVFSKVTLSLKAIENQQLNRIQSLTIGASETASAIAGILQRSGIDVAAIGPSEPHSGVGGPYLAPSLNVDFDASLDGLDSALNRLESMRETARRLPYANPAPGKAITSRFGNRVDPFIGRMALHAGIDFRSATGSEIQSSGAGVVSVAGPSGGYGNMVEIDHGFGLSTRYGHMSKILVKEGQEIEAGHVIGLAGSTGRSTGPHLHYEVRRNGDAVDPMHFLNTGLKLEGLID